MPYNARYVFSFEDYRLLLRALQPQNRSLLWPFKPWMPIGIFLLMSIAPALEAAYKGAAEAFWHWVTGAGQAGIFFAVLLLFLRSSLLQRMFYPWYSIAGQALSYELDAKGVSWVREGMKGEYDWSAFRQMTVTPAAAVLVLGKSEAIVLPARAFSSQAEFEAAVEFARAKIPPEKSVPAASFTECRQEPVTPFTARYVFSLGDLNAQMNAARTQSQYRMWFLRLLLIAGLLLIFAFPYLQASLAGDPDSAALKPGLVSDVLPLFLIFAAWEVVMRTSILARICFPYYPLAEKEVTYRLGGKGVSWTRDNMHGEYAWHAIEAAIAGPDAAVLLTDRREGIVLPARAFASQAEYEAAANFARAKIASKEDAGEQ